MKSINDFIIEKLKVSTNISNGPTVADFICWYYGLTDISDFTFDVFEISDFDPGSLDDYFNGDTEEQYEYIMKHIDDPIGKITVTNPFNDPNGDFEHEFIIGNVPFFILCNEEFPQKKY
jgi:hypothetical protein